MDTEALQLRVNILFFLNTLKANGAWEPWEEKSKTFHFGPENNGNGILGTMDINHPLGTTEILQYDQSTIVDVTRTEENHFKACVNALPVSYFNLKFDYLADIAVKQILPIFGDGNILIGLKDCNLTMCWILDESQTFIRDMDIQITYRHGPASFTGFYKNKALDTELSDTLLRVQRYLARWATYEPECSRKCLFNEVVKFLTNNLIYGRNDGLSLECECLEGLYDGFYREVRSCSDASFTSMLWQRLVKDIIS